MQSMGKGEFRHGRRYLARAFLCIAGGFASLYFYAAGLSINPMQDAFGWSRAEASIGSIGMSIAAAVSLPIAERLSDRHGALLISLLSSLGLVAGFLLLSTLTSGLVTFFSFVFLLTFFSAGTTQLTYNSVIVRHFSHWRGLALGLVMTGTGVGSVLVPLLLTPFIAEHGWRAGYAALAACAFPLGITAALKKRHRL